MTITVTFESIEEMRAAARELLRAEPEAQAKKVKVQLPDTSPAEALQKVAQTLKTTLAPSAAPVQQTTPTTAPAQPAVPQAVPTAEPAYKLDDLSRAGVQLVNAGKQPQLLELLAQFGVESLPALPVEQYGAFATALRAQGASI